MNILAGIMNYQSQLPVLFFFLFLFNDMAAQSKGRSWNVSTGINLPFGLFSDTHFPGAGADISYSNHRFGKLPVKTPKQSGFLLNAGADFYFGRKENISGHSFSYKGYFIIHTYGGVIYNLGKSINLNLVAGPALSVYNDNSRFNIGSHLSGTYYFTGKIGVTSSLLLIKENGANWLGSASVKGSWAF